MLKEEDYKPDFLPDETPAPDPSTLIPIGRLEYDANFLKAHSSVPTHHPTTNFDKFWLYVSGTTYRLYIYDTANKTWRYASLT